MKEVYVVYKTHGPWEGVSVHAICSDEESAAMAKDKLCGMKFFRDGEPFAIEKVSLDMIYPFSIMQNEKLAIRR